MRADWIFSGRLPRCKNSRLNSKRSTALKSVASIEHADCRRHFRQSALCVRLVGTAAATATRVEPRVAEHRCSAIATAVACLEHAAVCHRHFVADYKRATVSGDAVKGKIFEETSVVTQE